MQTEYGISIAASISIGLTRKLKAKDVSLPVTGTESDQFINIIVQLWFQLDWMQKMYRSLLLELSHTNLWDEVLVGILRGLLYGAQGGGHPQKLRMLSKWEGGIKDILKGLVFLLY